jgi:hypothetical protein
MPNQNEPLAIAGINPADRRCCLVAQQSVEDVMEALEQGLIIVPVTADTAREIFGQTIDDLCVIARCAE